MATPDWNFPTEPIGGGNPYHRCKYCKRSVPEINGELEKHLDDCEWIKIRQQEDRNSWKETPSANKGYFWVHTANSGFTEIVYLTNGNVLRVGDAKAYPVSYFRKWKGPIDEDQG